MKKLLIIITIILICFLASCDNIEIVNNKITYDSNNREYQSDIINNASNTLFYVAAKTIGSSYKADALEILRLTTNNIEEIIRNQGINENKYDRFFDYLNNNKDLIIEKINNEEYGAEAINNLILEAFNDLGLKNITNSLYEIIIYLYDEKIDEYDENSKEVKALKSHYEKLRDEAKTEKLTFSNIDKEMFYKLIKGFIMIDKFFQNDFTNDSSLSDNEMVLFIQKIDFNISFENDEWYVIFKNLKSIGKFKDFASSIISDDLSATFGKLITDIFKFFEYFKKTIDEDMIESFKNASKDEILATVINSLSEAEKAVLAEIFANKFDSKYLNYLDSYIETDMVKNSTNKELNDLYNLKTFDALYGVIRRVFYD